MEDEASETSLQPHDLAKASLVWGSFGVTCRGFLCFAAPALVMGVVCSLENRNLLFVPLARDWLLPYVA